MKYTLSILVENLPGVLSKVSGLFSRRGFNIDSLAVGVTENDSISRITIVVDGDEHIVEQVEKQLNKLISVIKVKNLTEGGNFIHGELAMIKVNCTAKAAPGDHEDRRTHARENRGCGRVLPDPANRRHAGKHWNPDQPSAALWDQGKRLHRHRRLGKRSCHRPQITGFFTKKNERSRKILDPFLQPMDCRYIIDKKPMNFFRRNYQCQKFFTNPIVI